MYVCYRSKEIDKSSYRSNKEINQSRPTATVLLSVSVGAAAARGQAFQQQHERESPFLQSTRNTPGG